LAGPAWCSTDEVGSDTIVWARKVDLADPLALANAPSYS